MWGAPDLEAGIEKAHELFGVIASPGGSHPGLGTRNALLALGSDVYLEIIAPDPDQQLANTFGGRLKTMQQCQLITWAVAASPLNVVASSVTASGINATGPIATERTTIDGELLSWELLFISGHSFGNLMPFFIDWHNTVHPAKVNPPAGEFSNICLSSPRAKDLQSLFEKMDVEVLVKQASTPAISVEIATAKGLVTLESTESSINMKLF